MTAPRHVAKPLLSPPEQMLYGRLVRAFPGHVVLAHVALSRFLNAAPAGGEDLHESADFVVFNPDFTPFAVVELDAGSARRGPLDHCGRKDALLGAAGIRVLRIAAVDLPREASLKSLVLALPAGRPTVSRAEADAAEMRRAS